MHARLDFMNTPKTHDNRTVMDFLSEFSTVGELLESHPRIGDILAGVLAARSAGDGSTRSLSRRYLINVLQACPVVTAENIASVIDARSDGQPENLISVQTARKYAAAARVASRAIDNLISGRHTGLIGSPNQNAITSKHLWASLREPDGEDQGVRPR